MIHWNTAQSALVGISARLSPPIEGRDAGACVARGLDSPAVVSDALRRGFDLPMNLATSLSDLLPLMHLDDREAACAVLQRALRMGEDFDQEVRAEMPGEPARALLMRGGLWQDSGADGPLLVAIFTPLHDSLLAARETERRLRMALDAADAWFWTWDLSANEMVWDEHMEVTFGLARGTFEAFSELVHPDDTCKIDRALKGALGGGPNYDIVYRMRDQSRDWRYVKAQGVLDRNRSGEPVRMIGLCLDVTDRLLAEEKLREANSELDHFAYVASHDLRAPLRAIDNLAEWIVEDAEEHLPARSREHLHKLQQRVRRMEQLLEDIQAFSRAGRLTYKPEQVDTGQLVAEVVQTLAPPDGFDVHVSSPLPNVVSPRSPLEQVFLNLIGNSIKHHDRPAGRVTVEAIEGPLLVEFCVADDGPGIPADLHDKAFQMFETLRPRDDVEGSGIGLAVVRKLVESVGGRVWIDQTDGLEGRGSAFRFTWPKEIGVAA